MIKVYIVEDDPMVLDVNRRFLEKLPQFTLCGTATTAKDAIQEIEETEPDLVLLDMFLPDHSGLDLLKSIRNQEVHCDVIMITAARDVTTIKEVFRLGAVDYLVKPFRFDRFQLALESYAKMWKKLNKQTTLNQEDIDEFKQIRKTEDTPPKGLSQTTMRQILLHVIDQSTPVTAEQVASSLGMARVTVRRYLDYLEQSGKINVRIQYGTVGRPSHHYYV